MADHDARRARGASPRRRLSPEDRRSELLALGAEVFGQRPYDEVRIDEIAERAGVSRALMYHYFPDKRAFFAAVVRAEGERLFEATNTPPQPGLESLRADCAQACWPTWSTTRRIRTVPGRPTWAWADPIRCCAVSTTSTTTARPTASSTASPGRSTSRWTPRCERDLRVVVYGWLAFTFEMCRQRIVDPSIDAGYVADTCAHALLDAVARMPAFDSMSARSAALRA